MKFCQSAGKVHDESAIRKNIPAYKNVVWRVKGGEVHHLKINLGGREKESGAVAGSDDGLEAGHVGGGFPNFVKSEFIAETGPQSRANGAGVDQGAHGSHARSNEGQGGDSDIECGAVLENVLNRLLEYDLGPGGFFVICHRDSDLRPTQT